MQQAAEGTGQVSANIVDVQCGAGETGSASSQVLSAAQSLSRDSNRLKLEVGKFLNSVRAAWRRRKAASAPGLGKNGFHLLGLPIKFKERLSLAKCGARMLRPAWVCRCIKRNRRRAACGAQSGHW